MNSDVFRISPSVGGIRVGESFASSCAIGVLSALFVGSNIQIPAVFGAL